MKFVALALALLLAVGEKTLSQSPTYIFFLLRFMVSLNTLFHFSGSQAVPMMADAPTQLQHIRAAADVYLTHSIASLKNALGSLDDAEMK